MGSPQAGVHPSLPALDEGAPPGAHRANTKGSVELTATPA
jgi:hypothetical protein